ncbi:hypothetical protein V8D89_001666, partial [Ganoderma adspersum]
MLSKTIPLNAPDHPIKAVTIFQSSTAQLTRTFSIDLKGGSNVLVISGISSHVDTESPRIYGLGSDARVFDISCNTKLANAPHQKYTKDAAAIKRLVAKRKLLEVELDVRRTEFFVLDETVRLLAKDKATSLDSLMDTFVARKRNAKTTIIEMDEQIEELAKEIWLLNNLHTGATAAVVTATVLAKRDCKVEFQLTYLVTGVTWKPYYDLHATTSDEKPSSDVSVHYCANITQTTGEDWTNAVLTLSTASSHALHSLTVPKVDALRLLPTHPLPSAPDGLFGDGGSQQQQPLYQQDQQRQHYLRRQGGIVRTHAVVPGSPGRSVEHFVGGESDRVTFFDELPKRAVLEKNPLSLAYRVEGRVSLPSDGVAHKVPIAVLAFEAALKYVCVPRKTSAAFIEARIKNTSEYELLAGPVSVFMDDNFVTKTSLGLISVNDSFTCVLGIDTSLKVSYQTKSHTEHEPKRSFAEPSKTTTRTVTTTITNGHSFDLSGLVVCDVIPLGHDEASIKVALRRPEGLAQAKDGEEVTVALSPVTSAAGDLERQEAKVHWTRTENGVGGEKEGLYEWVCELKAGEKVRLEAEWEVKAPSSLQWEEQP